MLNSGYRRGGVVSLCVKDGGDFDLRDFHVFGAKVLAGIGKLPDTVQDRSIPIELRRKARNEHAKRFRERDAKHEAQGFGKSLEGWSASAVPILEQTRPALPEELGDRAADVWEPLLAIADLAGGEWPERARNASLTLSAGSVKEDDSLGVMLLKDVRGVFQERKIDRMASADLVQALLKIEESPWGDLSGKPLDAGRLAKLLKPFGIGPKQLRLGPDNKKGYEPKFFEDSWDRYIPVLGETPETPKQMASNEPGEGVLVVSAKSLLPETTPQGETKFEPEKANVSAVSPVSAFQGLGWLTGAEYYQTNHCDDCRSNYQDNRFQKDVFKEIHHGFPAIVAKPQRQVIWLGRRGILVAPHRARSETAGDLVQRIQLFSQPVMHHATSVNPEG